jgi:hypothetical protein
MARDGGTGSLARRMLSIQMYNISSSSVNRSIEALKVFCLVSSESKADHSRIESCFSQTFRIAPSLTSYSCALKRVCLEGSSCLVLRWSRSAGTHSGACRSVSSTLQRNVGDLGMERLKYAPIGKVCTKLRGSSCVLKRETTLYIDWFELWTSLYIEIP